MAHSADSFGAYGRRWPSLVGAANAADRLVTGVIALALAVAGLFAAYALWDTYELVESSTAGAAGLTFADYLAANEDVVGWLVIDNTGIDYPVVQGEDDYEYLTTSATGSYSASGAIFLDAACSAAFDEPYAVIMGHHMTASAMFGDLDLFLDEEFFAENSTGALYLLDRTLYLEVVAVLEVDAYDKVIYGVPADVGDMASIVERIGELVIFEREGAYSADDQLIALSTCSSDGATARTVLICRVSGEGEAVDPAEIGG